MTNKSKVIWNEGLLIAPQHFQQQQRYNDYVLNFKFGHFVSFAYGFSKLNIEQELLTLGRIGISEAVGIMPDGTVFEIPYQDLLPKPIEIKNISTKQSAYIYLALPITNDVINEIGNDNNSQMVLSSNYRYQKNIYKSKDLHSENGDYTAINVAKLAPFLVQGSEDLSGYTVLPLCLIKEISVDGSLVLDDTFIPTICRINASSYLHKFVIDVANLIAERAKQLVQRIGTPTQQGVTGIAEFLMLQLLNSAKPYYRHIAHTGFIHPEELYIALTKICSQLMTFTAESKNVPDFNYYDHDDLTGTFKTLMLATRKALNIVLTPRAVAITLNKQNNLYVGVVGDTDLLQSAEFILAVRTDLPQDKLIKTFINQVKIASPLIIEDLVRVQLAGISLNHLTVSPPQLPFGAGYIYFKLDTSSKGWDDIIKSNSIAVHIAGNFTELDLQLWAIRGK